MDKNFYYHFKYPVAFLALLVFICTCSQVRAQRGSPKGINYDGDGWDRGGGGNGGGGFGTNSNWGVALNLGYDVPSKNLKDVYKATPTFGISILKNFKGFTFNISAGYHSYGVKAGMDTLFYDPEDPSAGFFVNGPLKVYELYGGVAYNFNITDNIRIYPGINFGLYYTRSMFQDIEGVVRTTITTTEQNMYFAPKLGFTYALNERIGLGFEGKYNIFTPSGNSRQGNLISYSSYTGNVMLSYNF